MQWGMDAKYVYEEGKSMLEIVRVEEEQREILAHLIELYEYDFSEYEDSDVNSYGLYGYSYLDYYWTEENRHPYFIKVNGKLAGFVMVCGFCYVSQDSDTLFMSEFFVMKKYRRQGIGKKAAIEVLKKHPGKWELTVHPNNPTSHKFWKSVIADVADKHVREVTDVEDVYDDALATAYLFEVSSAEQEELTFSRVNLEDLDEFMKAKIDAFSDDVKQYGFGPTGYDDYEKEKENIVNYPVYKMVLNGKIIGGMTCCDQGDGMFWLGGIYIDSKHQNMGIGAKAITFLEKEFPQAKCWRLDTPYKNYRNHHFYEKMGYKKIGETEPKADKDGFYLFVYEKVMQ